MLYVLYLDSYIFVVVLLSLIRKRFLAGFCLSYSLAMYHRDCMKKFPCGIFKKAVPSNHNAVYCDICTKWVHISCNNITRYCYRKLQKDETPWHCKICLGQAMPFSNLTGHQLEAFMLGKLITSLKLIQSNNQLLFPNFNTENISKNQYNKK